MKWQVTRNWLEVFPLIGGINNRNMAQSINYFLGDLLGLDCSTDKHSYRLDKNIVFSVQQSGFAILVQGLDVVARGPSCESGLLLWTVGHSRVGNRRPANWKAERLLADRRCWGFIGNRIYHAIPLDQLISGRVSPIVVLGFHLAVVQGAGTDQQGCQNLSANWISDQSLFLVISIAVLNYMINYVHQALVKQSNPDPQISRCFGRTLDLFFELICTIATGRCPPD